MTVQSRRQRLIQAMQRLGYALLLPVSILPLAALLHRLGEPDVLNLPVLVLSGQAIFGQMPLIYAVAIAFGIGRTERGSLAFSGAVNFLLLSSALSALAPGLHADLVCGMLAGITTALVAPWSPAPAKEGAFSPSGPWQGPLLSALLCLLLAVPMSWLWPALEQGISQITTDLATPLGAFCYGVLNRLLLPFGLHQLLGNLALLGEVNQLALATAQPLHQGYGAGLYPIVMFGLPGACFAIWLHRHRLRQVPHGALLLSLALTSACIGITEPIEFLFAFTAPWLFLAHALLTGLSFAICSALDIEIGSYFSAGLLDLSLSYGRGLHAFWVIPLGIMFFVGYALLFYRLLGRVPLSLDNQRQEMANIPPADPQMLAIQYLKLLGGMDNLQAISVCLTRLSVRVREMALVDTSQLLNLGCLSWIEINEHQLVLVLGPNAGLIEGQIRMLAERQAVPLGLKPNHDARDQGAW
ncbi:PTS transporter subunit EIIC [Aeromonas bivalvium]|uniref:PTS transporter subunit EIIC n=1 Tax=Aeromonas bivalvium TaxID=440079 RepID=UPI0038CF8C52